MEIGAKKKKRATMSTSDSLICGKLRETESRMMVARGWGAWRKLGGDGQKDTNFQL